MDCWIRVLVVLWNPVVDGFEKMNAIGGWSRDDGLSSSMVARPDSVVKPSGGCARVNGLSSSMVSSGSIVQPNGAWARDGGATSSMVSSGRGVKPRGEMLELTDTLNSGFPMYVQPSD